MLAQFSLIALAIAWLTRQEENWGMPPRLKSHLYDDRFGKVAKIYHSHADQSFYAQISASTVLEKTNGTEYDLCSKWPILTKV